ncbi:MAG TPA: 23S rRNA (pseudouridine(1915)-N(3))-methyltransferase RlmH [Blastocatellia bacterium]|nr:23S rRNA (pseudouridine(1915)-N(3))-methyltransferase RlmH [Blastocatellia bacterium]
MKLRFVWIGKTRRLPIRELVTEYLGRIGRFAQVEVTELRDRNAVGSDTRVILDKEGADILARTSSDPFVVVLDERGRQLDSLKLAELVERHRIAGTRQITFVLGGHAGISDVVRKQADLVLSLSRMTLTHELARIVLVEQVYRAFTIIHDLPYHK